MNIRTTVKNATEANHIEFAKSAEARGIDLHFYANFVRGSSVVIWLSILALICFFSMTVGIIFAVPAIWFIYQSFIGAAAIDRYADM